MMSVIETVGLGYAFRSKERILNNLALDVPQGSIYGFLGPNGAGKTTTLRLLLALLRQQEGTIRIFGHDLREKRLEILRRTGTLIEQPSLYLHLTGRENLEVYRKIFGTDRSRIAKVLDLVHLGHAANKKARAYSLGMKQRLAIAIALLHDPELLILDEPTNGLDPSGIIEVRELLKELHREHGKTILVSSHLLTEIEKMATHVGIIHHGNLLFQGTLKALQDMKARQSNLAIDVSDVDLAKQILETGLAIKEIRNERIIMAYEGREQAAALNKLLVSHGIAVYQLAIQQNDLEQLFLHITNDQQPSVQRPVSTNILN